MHLNQRRLETSRAAGSSVRNAFLPVSKDWDALLRADYQINLLLISHLKELVSCQASKRMTILIIHNLITDFTTLLQTASRNVVVDVS